MLAWLISKFSKKKPLPTRKLYVLKKLNSTGEHVLLASYSFDKLEEQLNVKMLSDLVGKPGYSYLKNPDIENCYTVYDVDDKHYRSYLIEEVKLI